MKIEAQKLRKRFGLHWIVYDFSHTFESGSRTAVLGPNGSGKSTLLKLLSGQLLPSEGDLDFSAAGPVGMRESGNSISDSNLYKEISLCGPYVELIEELTGEEAANLHAQLRGFRQNLTPADLWERVGWSKRIRKQTVASYSSGMKQRMRLLLALATDSSALYLDEPTSNLDTEGVDWYQQLVTDWAGDRTVLIASNEERDFVDCSARIDAQRWQK
ncbi:MAG: ATP-binding cassette domain-containing protein [Saprospiraceae bacterium]